MPLWASGGGAPASNGWNPNPSGGNSPDPNIPSSLGIDQRDVKGSVAYGDDPTGSIWNNEVGQWQKYGSQGVQPTGVDPSLANAQNNSYAQQQQSLGQQQDAYNMMAAQAAGGDTPAQQQARASLAYANNAQRAMTSNAGSGQALAAARSSAAQNSATQASNTANQMNALKAQEMATGRGAMGAMADQQRSNAQDLYGINNNQAYGIAENQANLNAANDQLMLGYGNMMNQAQNANRLQQTGQGEANIIQNGVNFQQGMQGVSMGLGALESGAKGIANAYGSDSGQPQSGNTGASGDGSDWGDVGPDNGNNWGSDERLKTGVVRGGLMSNFLDTLAHSRATYKYKNPADEPRSIPTGGRYAGVMAQDLERVPEIGHQLIIDTPHGKYVDQKTMTSALSAGLGEIHERVRRLEGRR